MNRKTTSMLLVAAMVLLACGGHGLSEAEGPRRVEQGRAGVPGRSVSGRGGALQDCGLARPDVSDVARAYLAMAYMMQYIPGARVAGEPPHGAGGARRVHEGA